jgi:hypothetical protein
MSILQKLEDISQNFQQLMPDITDVTQKGETLFAGISSSEPDLAEF